MSTWHEHETRAHGQLGSANIRIEIGLFNDDFLFFLSVCQRLVVQYWLAAPQLALGKDKSTPVGMTGYTLPVIEA